jgi:type I restriction enzyme S subunit
MKYVRLGDVVKIISGFPFESKLFNDQGVGLPLIRVRDVNSGFSGMYYSGEYSKDFLIENGDILVSMDGDFKIVVWNNGTALLNQRVCKIIPDDNKLNKFYLLHYLYKELIRIHERTTFTTVKHLSIKTIEAIRFPYPSINEQNRLATVLTRAEALIAKRNESIKALDELLKSTFQEMFGTPMRMLHQPKTKLDKFITFLTSGSRGWAQYYSETGDIFIRINNVRDACFKLDDIVYVTPPKNAEAVRTKVKKNDLLFSITADLGRTAVVNEKLDGAFINQHLALIRLKLERINPLFVAWYFAMPYGKSIVMKNNKEAVKAGLNFDDIRGLEIITPPLSLQNQFAGIVEKVEVLKSKYIHSLADLEKLYGALSQRAFKGELDLNNILVESDNKIPASYELEKVPKDYSKNILDDFIQSRVGKPFTVDSFMTWLEEANYNNEIPKYEDIKEQIYGLLKESKLTQVFEEVKDESGKVEKKIMLRA